MNKLTLSLQVFVIACLITSAVFLIKAQRNINKIKYTVDTHSRLHRNVDTVFCTENGDTSRHIRFKQVDIDIAKMMNRNPDIDTVIIGEFIDTLVFRNTETSDLIFYIEYFHPSWDWNNVDSTKHNIANIELMDLLRY